MHLIRRMFVVVGAVLGATLLAGCAGQTASEALLDEAAANIATNPNLSADFVTADARQMHYRSIGNARVAIAVWIHGTPGGWSDIRRLMVQETFTDQVRLVSVDRPGWGDSATDDNNFSWGSFEAHSKLFRPLLERLSTNYPNVPIVIAGHSWGGSLVPTLVADHPDLISGALVLAGGLDPALSDPRWYNRLATTWLAQKIIGDDLRHANLEIYALRDELAQQAPRLAGISRPILIVQGNNDKLVSPEHMNFAKHSFNPNNARVVRLQNQGHLLQVQRAQLIGRCILAAATHQLGDCNEAPNKTELR